MSGSLFGSLGAFGDQVAMPVRAKHTVSFLNPLIEAIRRCKTVTYPLTRPQFPDTLILFPPRWWGT